MEGTKYGDPTRVSLIDYLRKEGKGQALWARVAKDLAKSRKGRAEVNIDKINKFTKAKDTVVVAGKILAGGELDHEVTVACFKMSTAARTKIEDAKGKILSFEELVKKNPKGSNIIILK